MDGFDDLLAPSRSVLESNPFADPFAKRSDSPDPWASFHQPSASGFQDSDTNTFGDDRSTTPTMDEPSHSADYNGFAETESIANDDPLEAAALTSDAQEVEAPRSPVVKPQEVTSPGFRESISHSPERSESPVRQPSPPSAPVEAEPAPISPTSPISSEPAVRIESPFVSPKNPTFPSPPTSSSPPPSKQSFYNPLDQVGGLGIDRSFAGLSLGGEALGGWQGSSSSQNAWGSSSIAPSEDDDDDDDDKPILQARMRVQAHAQAQAQAAASVCFIIRS